MHLHWPSPITRTPAPGGQTIYSFGRPFLCHYYYTLSLSDLCIWEENILREIMPYYYMTCMAIAYHKNPCLGGHEIHYFGRPFKRLNLWSLHYLRNINVIWYTLNYTSHHNSLVTLLSVLYSLLLIKLAFCFLVHVCLNNEHVLLSLISVLQEYIFYLIQCMSTMMKFLGLFVVCFFSRKHEIKLLDFFILFNNTHKYTQNSFSIVCSLTTLLLHMNIHSASINHLLHVQTPTLLE